MESLLVNFSETDRIIAYSIIFLIVFLIEGGLTLPLAGALSRNHFLDIYDLLFIGLVAAVMHDILYWSVGIKLAETHQKKLLFINIDKISGLLGRLKKRYGVYIFLSKFAWGLNKPVLAATGFLRVPFKELIRYSAPTCFIWVISITLLGYAFASKTNLLIKDLKTAALLISGLMIVMVVLENILRRIIKEAS